ncbi:hypothetical protein [Lysobacter gummosus]|uniref:hypothetical protein n=1 Tax=Lysobacter gummosus TaxID=262324 RepID=UPI0036368F92
MRAVAPCCVRIGCGRRWAARIVTGGAAFCLKAGPRRKPRLAARAQGPPHSRMDALAVVRRRDRGAVCAKSGVPREPRRLASSRPATAVLAVRPLSRPAATV